VDEHGGQLSCLSVPAQGATLAIEIPIHRPKKHSYKEDLVGL
jgi:signal transduction histidine kinase